MHKVVILSKAKDLLFARVANIRVVTGLCPVRTGQKSRSFVI